MMACDQTAERPPEAAAKSMSGFGVTQQRKSSLTSLPGFGSVSDWEDDGMSTLRNESWDTLLAQLKSTLGPVNDNGMSKFSVSVFWLTVFQMTLLGFAFVRDELFVLWNNED